MADTLNMLVHNKTVPKLIETNNFMIINGTLYQKSNLSSMKKAFSFGSDLANNVLHISRSMYLMDNARRDNRARFKGIKEDIYIENRSYIIVNNQYANVNNTLSYIIALQETDNDVEIINILTSPNNVMYYEIVSITDTYLFVSAREIQDGAGNPAYLSCIKKSDFSIVKNIIVTGNSIPTSNTTHCIGCRGYIVPIYENQNYLWCMENGYSSSPLSGYNDTGSNNFALFKLNKSSLEVETKEIMITDYKNTKGNVYKDYIHNFYQIGNNIYFFMYKAKSRGDHPNADVGILGYYKCKIDLTKQLNDAFSKQQITNFTNQIGYICYTYKQTGYFIKDNYVFYYIADETNGQTNIWNYQGLHKFEISNDFDLTYIKRFDPMPTTRIISILFNEDYSIIIIGYYQSFDILIYEEETHDYVKVGKTFTGIKSVGLDSLNRLWYETISGEIHTENFDDPQDVVVEFEKPYYSYLSGELETYVTFKARSATGVVPTGRYILRITTGNAYFKETGTNELVINYESMSQDGDHYPLMITGPKRIVCNVSFEKVW